MKFLKIVYIMLLFSLLILTGCSMGQVRGDEYRSTSVNFNPNIDINKIRRVTVVPTERTSEFTGAAGMWETDLIRLGFTVLDRGNIETILNEHGLSLSGLIKPDESMKIGQLLGVDALLFVDRSITQPSTFRIDYGQTHMVDMTTGSVIFTARLGRNTLSLAIKEELEKAGWKYFVKKISKWQAAPIRSKLPNFDQDLIQRVAVSTNAQHDLIGALITAGYEVIERKQLENILQEQALSLSGLLKPEDMERIGQIYGIQGMAFSEGFYVGALHFYLVKLVELESGKIVWSFYDWNSLEDSDSIGKIIKKILKQ